MQLNEQPTRGASDALARRQRLRMPDQLGGSDHIVQHRRATDTVLCLLGAGAVRGDTSSREAAPQIPSFARPHV
jgi:hypothetical protein